MKKQVLLAKMLMIMAFTGFLSAFSSQSFAQCDIDVTISSSGWGDETTWTFTDNASNVVLSGGPYGFGFTDFQSIIGAANEPYTLTINTLGPWNDNTPNYNVTIDGSPVFVGMAPGGQVTTISNILCSSTPPPPGPCIHPFVWGFYGLIGNIPNVESCAFAGYYLQYTGITSGEEYSFSSATGTDWLTLTDEFNAPLDFGTGSLTWTASFSGTVRLHVSANSACSADANCREITAVCNTCSPPLPGDCVHPTPYGNLNIPNNGNPIVQGCTFAGEYVTFNNTVIGESYEFSSTVGSDWLTLTDAANNVLLSGTTPISWTATFAGSVRVHVSTSSLCGTQNTCRDISAVCTSCSPPAPGDCIHPTPYGNQIIPNNGFPVTQGCAFAGEYVTFTNTEVGEIYEFSSTTGSDWLTLTDASDNVLLSGTTPISWAATYAGSVRVHVSTSSLCGTQSACRDISAVCTSCSPPLFSPCDIATPIACGDVVTGSTVGAPTDPVVFCGTPNGTGGKVWYEFTGSGEVVTASTCNAGSNYDTKLWVFSGDCNNLTCVTGNDDSPCGFGGLLSNVEFATTSGETYYIVVGGFSAGQGNYELSVTCSPLPVIPDCATNINVNIPACGAGSIEISWDPVANATNFNIYAGTAPGLNDIANPFLLVGQNNVFLNNPTLNTTFYMTVVPVNLAGEAVGCIEFSFVSQGPCPPPANDDICDATDVTNMVVQDLNTYAFLAGMTCDNNIGNTSNGSPSPVGPTCGAANGNDTWYSFTTPMCSVGGAVPFTIELTTNNPGTNYDSKIALFVSDDNTCTGNMTQVACNDDNGSGGNPSMCGANPSGLVSAIIIDALQPNTQYWVYVGGFNGSTGTYELSGRALTPAHGVAAVGGGTQIQLTTTNMGAALYTYYYKQVGSTGYSTANSQTALTDTRTLAPGNDYITQIMYRCDANFFNQNQWYRTEPQIIALENQCALVNDMTCTFNGPNSYTLTWTEPTGDLFTNNGALTGYRIKRNPIGSTGIFTFSNPAVVCSGGTCSVTLAGNSPTGFNWTIETRCSANTVQVGNTTSCGPLPGMATTPDHSNNTDRMAASMFSFVNAEAGIEFVDVQMFDAYGEFGLNTPMIGDYEIFVNENNEINWRRVNAPADMSFDFIIVPNPTNAVSTVYLSTIVEEGSYTVIDAMGRTINAGSINNTDNIDVDATQLQSGVYMVVVTVGNQQLTRRLIVAN